MRRGAKPAKPKAEAKQAVTSKSLKSNGSRVRDLEQRLAESLEQQTATAEILRVISTSPTDVRPAFEAIAASAGRVCEAEHANVYRFDGGLIHLVASHGHTAEAARPRAPSPRGPSLTSRTWPRAATSLIRSSSRREFAPGAPAARRPSVG